MSTNPEDQLSAQKVQAIDCSLNMLKQLQSRLKNSQQHYSPFSKKAGEPAYSHTRIRTQPYSFTQRNMYTQHNNMTINEVEEQHAKNTYLPNTYSHSQPTMVEFNQNQHTSIKQIVKENRKLKKYVNCLLQMNDYLKNQLVKRDFIAPAGKMGHSFELQLMKMEVQYLKELNRDKQLDLLKFQHLGAAIQIPRKSKSKSKKKSTHQRTPSFQQSHHKQSHHRSSSAYQMFERNRQPNVSEFNLHQDHLVSSDEPSSHRIMKSMQIKRNNTKAPPSSKKNSTSSNRYSNSQIEYKNNTSVGAYGQSKVGKKKKVVEKANTGLKKCRLCYF